MSFKLTNSNIGPEKKGPMAEIIPDAPLEELLINAARDRRVFEMRPSIDRPGTLWLSVHVRKEIWDAPNIKCDFPYTALSNEQLFDFRTVLQYVVRDLIRHTYLLTARMCVHPVTLEPLDTE